MKIEINCPPNQIFCGNVELFVNGKPVGLDLEHLFAIEFIARAQELPTITLRQYPADFTELVECAIKEMV